VPSPVQKSRFPTQWAKSLKKQSVGVSLQKRIFDKMALYFEFRINNALFQTVFLAILPTGEYFEYNGYPLLACSHKVTKYF